MVTSMVEFGVLVLLSAGIFLAHAIDAYRDLPVSHPRPGTRGQQSLGVSKRRERAAKRLLARHPHKPRRARPSTGPRFPNRPSPPPEETVTNRKVKLLRTLATSLMLIGPPAPQDRGATKAFVVSRRCLMAPFVRRLAGGNG
jgi:hypothetical protein